MEKINSLKGIVAVLFVLLSIHVVGQDNSVVFNHAHWIAPSFTEDTILRPCPVFKKQINLYKRPVKATLFITAHGLYEALINNKRVGDAYFTPGWTNYDKRLLYQQYEIQNLFKKGENEIAVTVGDGWYRGIFGHAMKTNNYGSEASLLCSIIILYHDGSRDTIVSDDTWQCTTGRILHSDLYNGEMQDARINPSNWVPVKINATNRTGLTPSTHQPVKKQERFIPRKIFITPNGEQVIDFGQNIAGWVRVGIKGNAGDTIKIAHAELLDKEGNFYTGNLRSAKATDIYVLKGKGREVFEPKFTYHGFRYIKVEGCNAKKQAFTAIALYNDMPRTGTFKCSNPLINQLQNNIEWSLKSNFFDIPTDCPQRSERLGWTGDAQVFCRAAAYNRNVKEFFNKWLQTLNDEQGSNGAVSTIIPDLYGHKSNDPKKGASGWSDAATIIPWTMFRMYNDTAILRNQYTSMKAWVEYINSQSENNLWKANGFGDWLAPGETTSMNYINQCFWAYSTQLLINAATVLGKTADVDQYNAWLQKIKKAFLENYIDNNTKAITHTQTAYVLALQFDMLTGLQQSEAVKHLVALIKKNNYHLATGFLGTPHLLHVLTKYGHADIAYKLLMQTDFPSWLYPVKMGATTIWEKWDGIQRDGTIQVGSFNHYAYGAVGDWLYETVGGISPLDPGFKKVLIAPYAGGGLSWAKFKYTTAQGQVKCQWKMKKGKLVMTVTIPSNTLGVIKLYNGQFKNVGPGKYRIRQSFQGKSIKKEPRDNFN